MNSGFSLIEFLIVVAIILIIAAIAIPNLIRSRMAANESAAASNVRTVTTASLIYNTTWDNGYPPAMANLSGVGSAATCDLANLVDPIISTAPTQKAAMYMVIPGRRATLRRDRDVEARGLTVI